MAAAAKAEERAVTQIFRRRPLRPISESMHMRSLDADMADKLRQLGEAQGPCAVETQELFVGHGMNLSSAWFKSGYPVLLHSHDADCLYYVISGSLKTGTEEIAAGDGFLVPANTPYTYTAGPEGVEVLEFRTAEKFDIRLLARAPKYWETLFGKLAKGRERWADEPRPTRRVAD